MNELSFLQAWSMWLAGADIAHHELWGVTIMWWARVGKIIQGFAAILIVAEIVGRDRMARAGAGIADFADRVSNNYRSREGRAWLRAMVAFLSAPSGSDEEKKLLEEQDKYTIDTANFFVALALVILPGWAANQYTALLSGATVFGWIAIAAASLILYLVILVSVSPFVSFGLYMLWAAIVRTFNIAIMWPLIWMLRRPDIEVLAKITSVALFLIGFQFDLLGS